MSTMGPRAAKKAPSAKPRVAKPTPTAQAVAKKVPEPVGDDARTRILEAAHQLVGEKGFEATSIRDIARVSGANPALVYYYYGSKDGLFTALANANADRAAAVLREAAQLEGTTRERVRHFLQTWMTIICQKSRPISAWFRQAIHSQDAHGEVLRGRVAGNIAILAGILQEGIDRGELRGLRLHPMTVASGLMMSVAGLAMEVLLPRERTKLDISTDESRIAFIEGMLDVWFRGLEDPAFPKRKRTSRSSAG